MLRKSFMAAYTAPRIDASLVRHERAGQATCSRSFDSLVPVVCVLPHRRTGQFGSRTSDAVIGVESAEFSHGARTCSRIYLGSRESARVRATSEFTIFGVNGRSRVFGPPNTMECRVPPGPGPAGSSYVDL